MIYDFRMYTLKPGSTSNYMEGVREVGYPVRQRHGVKLAGWYASEVGGLNEVTHIWGFEDLKHMQEAKAAVYSDPEWKEKYVPRAQPLVAAQMTFLMNSPDFAPKYPEDAMSQGAPGFDDRTDMVYDFRQYTFRPGAVPQYMAAVEEFGVPIRKRHNVKLAGWFYSEVGELNHVTHIWGYKNLRHLKEGKEAVTADSEWSGKYLPAVAGLLVAQKTYLMSSPDFAPAPA